MPDGPKHTILVVEDEAVQLKVLSEKFSAEGFVVISALDGESGLRLATSEHPDIILLDNRMPNMSGFAMLKRLREHDDYGAKVPVIFFSNVDPGTKDEKEALEAISPTAYMMKSDTNLNDIVEKVKTTLG